MQAQLGSPLEWSALDRTLPEKEGLEGGAGALPEPSETLPVPYPNPSTRHLLGSNPAESRQERGQVGAPHPLLPQPPPLQRSQGLVHTRTW